VPSPATVIARAAAAGALALAAAGCGSSQSHVAQLGSTTTPTEAGGAPAGPGGSPTAQMLAYARCMRSHGVPAFPDPNGRGEIPKPQVVSARQSDPSRFDSANSACDHLLPSGGGNGETPADIARDWNQFRQFAQCMRDHGVPNWPGPTARSATDRRPAFSITAAGLDGNSSQLRAKAQQCAAQLHMNGLPAAR
jgi:hypothetical protein